MSENECKWKLYGYGSVAIDKPEGTNVIEVFLKDILYAAEGDVSKKTDMNLTVNDSEGIVKTEQVSSGTTIPARWLAESQPNRITAPDVRKNETVLVYRYANNDDYYWEKIFTEDKLRGKETVTFAFKNTDDLVEITLDNSYIFHVSTKNKLIQIHTAVNDGEKVGYDIIIDTKESTLSTIDTRGNHSTLKSLEDDWTIEANKSIHLKTTNFFVDASGMIDMKAGGSFNIKCGSFNMQSAGGTMAGAGGSYSFSGLISCSDLKTNVFSSANGHIHPHPHGNTGTPISM